MRLSLSAFLIILTTFSTACGLLAEPAATPLPPMTVTPPVVAIVTDVPPAVEQVTPLPEPTLTSPEPAFESTLDRVLQRGRLRCGVNDSLPGFGFREADGTFTGFDTDFCRALGAAVLGDKNAVEFVPLNTNERFQGVADRRVDVLFRNTTWTASRDIGTDVIPRLDFGPTIFHDGQRFMVRRSANITTFEDLRDKYICVLSDTTTQQNLRDQFEAWEIPFELIGEDTPDNVYDAYARGRCDAVTSDTSQLVSRRQSLPNPDDHIILEAPISREPLSPALIEQDSIWRDVVSWTIYAVIYAEELGVDSVNLNRKAREGNPDVEALLGIRGQVGERLGLKPDFARTVIQQVGNYEEIYNRNLGPRTPFNLDRGPNKAWNKGEGGVLSSPPFR
ncbi:amino acid ABC transporter substrate-binding protein [bacterium]|nr:amino acid ABC transporter substrate-binding protein [bacterium]